MSTHIYPKTTLLKNNLTFFGKMLAFEKKCVIFVL